MRVFLPVTTTYETLTFFAWLIPLTYLIIEHMYPIRSVGVFVTGTAFTLLAIASSPAFAPSQIAPVVPSLQSYWLVIHVLSMIIGIAFFTTAFGATVLYMWRRWRGATFDDINRIEEMAYKAIALGFPVLRYRWPRLRWYLGQRSLGLLLGMGSQGNCHAHRLACLRRLSPCPASNGDHRARIVGWLSIIAFLSVIYAWVGINYFVGGLHSFT